MIDDKDALELIDYWIANPGNERTIPEELKYRIDMKYVNILQRPYRKRGGIMTSESLKELRNDIRDRISKKQDFEQKNYWNKINVALSILTLIIISINAFIALESLKVNDKLAIQTTRMSDINQQLLEREELLEGPYLSAWQTNEIERYRGSFIMSQSGWDNLPHIGICFRNEGKTSTGPINVYSDNRLGFHVKRAYFENLPSHEGNCTTLGIMYCSMVGGEKCDVEYVPMGEIKIPIYFDCTLCGQKQYNMNVTMCIYNQTSDECNF